ncbi:hypothetical protein B0A50_05458 [Salinomyces thailandicus]|uniref:Uncharacterized protein n=1 Tax=Salinomyces thailandicus TaxID=706561 RepID=A0A4U0TTW7_9PEZI|nr:hypothetical protein B0A50_05458 [Salinomyces thailandica]
MATHDLRYTIHDLELATWRALSHSGSAMIPFITDDCIMQFPLGMKLTADSEPSTLEILRSPAFVPWKSFELDKVDVLAMGRDGAVISYLARASRASAPSGGVVEGDGEEVVVVEGEVGFEALCCSVWRFEAERWKMCFHQQTMVE